LPVRRRRVQRIQTDQGTEFFAETAQRRLMAEAIRFQPMPPRSPYLNGKVVRVQRTVLEEFWSTVDAWVPDIGDRLALWVHHYNRDRSQDALKWGSSLFQVGRLSSSLPAMR
jgi:transposase InsO family protein